MACATYMYKNLAKSRLFSTHLSPVGIMHFLGPSFESLLLLVRSMRSREIYFLGAFSGKMKRFYPNSKYLNKLTDNWKKNFPRPIYRI